VEAKSGHGGNARTRRQKSELENIADYLTHNKSDKISKVYGEFQRLLIHSPEINHRDRLNSIITNAHGSTSKYCFDEVESGLYYCATYVANTNILSPLVNKPPGSLIISSINQLKYSGLGYYPFSLSIYEPDNWYDFYLGKLMIIIAADTKVIEEKVSRQGISIKITGEWNKFPIEITDLGSDGRNKSNKSLVGGHFFGRLFYEFLSMDWLMDEIIYRYHHDSAI
jgi:hypothetical protein